MTRDNLSQLTKIMPASKHSHACKIILSLLHCTHLKNREYFEVIICIDQKSTISNTQQLHINTYRIFLGVTIFFTAALSFRLQNYLKKIFWIISRDETFPKYLKSFLSLVIIGAGPGLRRHGARGHVSCQRGDPTTIHQGFIQLFMFAILV